MKAAIYTRVSTDGQAEVEFNSCETQEIKIRSFISSQNDLEVYKVYSDQGYTGANTDRPALQELIGDIQAGKINTVMAYKIDRLTRSPKDFYRLVEIFDQHNVSFISVTERFDTSTPSGRLLRNIMLTFGQFERELISERIKDKIFERAKKGMWSCSTTPFGYKREDKKLVIDPGESKIIKYIFENIIATGSMYQIYKDLKSQKILDRKGLPLSKSAIFRMIRNISYTGLLKYKDSIYQGQHEPIISKELFEQAQQFNKERPKVMKTYNYSLFPGLVHCKQCGSIMSSVFTNKISNSRRVRYFYYRCTSIGKRDSSFCDIRQVSSDRLDAYVVDYLDKIAKNKQYLDSLIFTLNYQQQGVSKGIEPSIQSSLYSSEKVKEIINRIVIASKLSGSYEKRAIVKKYVKEILYSKDVIEVVLFYGSNYSPASINSSAITKARAPKQNTETVFCTHPKKTRQNSAAEKIIDERKIADIKIGAPLVCAENELPSAGPLRTITLIIPNTVHGCKKRDLGRL